MMKYGWIAAILLLVAVITFTSGMTLLNDYIFADNAPVQPINFSHKIHAGDNNIPCRFCHMYAWKSRVSGVPSVQRCMGCHKSVRTDSPEIKKLQAYWDAQKPIPWVKVYNVPDYIYFPHKRHVRGGVRCQECHGEVQNMARVERKPRIVMGWCLSCHFQRNGPSDCWECHI